MQLFPRNKFLFVEQEEANFFKKKLNQRARAYIETMVFNSKTVRQMDVWNANAILKPITDHQTS
jgi:hypothetical protein